MSAQALPRKTVISAYLQPIPNVTPSVNINGKSLSLSPGENASAALARAGVQAPRTSAAGQPRAPFCGMGICHECRLTIDAVPHRLGCQTFAESATPCAPKDVHFDVLIIGAGPAGMAAAWSAAQSGQTVGVVDDNPTWGGQIWRGNPAGGWLRQVTKAGAVLLPATRVFAQPKPGQLWAESAGKRITLEYTRLILAVGARERFLPFPGWTLPGVFGAGGLQALVKSGFLVEGKHVIVAGSGPLLLAVAAYLRSHKARVRLVAEQAGWAPVMRFATGLLRHPRKLFQALTLKSRLLGVPYRTHCWPVAAIGNDCVTSVLLTDGTRQWNEACDYLACGFGLDPNAELPALLSCHIEKACVIVDDQQRTSVPGIYAAGELVGIGGLECSLVEGQIAGYAATGQTEKAQRLFPARLRARRFAAALERTFALREELKDLPRLDTLVCRCEDVPLGRLDGYKSWREAKLQTRCGMGPCQGRVCGPALAFLRGWDVESIRPPVSPVRIGSLLNDDVALPVQVPKE